MSDPLKRLRDAVTGRGREVEVKADGTVQEIAANTPPADAEASPQSEPAKTKLAPRTFGAR